MIPGSFDYHRPKTIGDAVGLLAGLGIEARPLSGGHSLIPMMKLRMASPEHLVDLAAIPGLRGITRDGGDILIGAFTTQAEVIASDLLAQAVPLLRETALTIADPQIRGLGTIGGNVANGDPGNDMPAIMQALDARYILHGPGGSREVAARAYYQAAYVTSLAPGELVAAIRVAVPAAGHGYAYEKLKRKVGDYAIAAAGVVVTLAAGRVTHVAIGLTNLADTPLYAADACAVLMGSALDAATMDRAVVAAEDITSPASDGRGPAAYRTKMAGVMLRRALARAVTRAT